MTSFTHGVLTLSREEAGGLLAHPALGSTRLSWASPGESVRIVKVLDAVEPRTKGPGGGGIGEGADMIAFLLQQHADGRQDILVIIDEGNIGHGVRSK